MIHKLKAIDSVEFAVKSLGPRETQLMEWGFQKIGTQKSKGTQNSLWAQGKIRILLTQGLTDDHPASRFVQRHGDGICDIAFVVDDARAALEEVAKRGATVVSPGVKEEAGTGEIWTSRMAAMGDVTHTFVSRHGTTQFSSGIKSDVEQAPHGVGLFAVDHLTCNLEMGELDRWAEFYERVFDFKQTRFFNISTGRTGLISKVMENKEGTVKIPLNEATDKKSQIQEYIDINHGPGIQHLALLTADILDTLPRLRKGGQKFLDVPDTYYEEVPKRVKDIRENMKDLQTHRILVDGDKTGYLLQIFSENTVGPFFFEVIQRCGNKGFGEGNFKALFEAIERDQERRGVL